MRYRELSLAGAFVIELDVISDHRGFFARTWDGRDLEAHGLVGEIAQCNVSYNVKRGTVRGLHFQRPPHEEVKLVRCTRGAVVDFIVDIRPGSPTLLRWESVELTAENRLTLYVPRGFAHGYQTLVDDTEISYQVSEYYHPESEGTILWSDPEIGIQWPVAEVTISEKDRSARPFSAAR
ncbi:MAG TPA: dTDP-4-dehydrorhamnose 3,5-epimerase [Candidatus Dormibacteraeota bacterium]|nr:dTDP-4-dehydrorhamnose 3,5-epimerase [Candidatus Dormibacteraeota bacterium]